LRQVATLLQKELGTRLAKVQDPKSVHFDPIHTMATFLDPRYRLLLNKNQTESARNTILKEVSLCTCTYSGILHVVITFDVGV